MGFPVGYSELPKLLLHLLLLLAHLRKLINFVFQSLGLSCLLEPEAHRYEPSDHGHGDRRRHLQDLCSVAAELIRESSPAVQFGDLLLMAEGGDDGRGLPETCAVCLCEFEGGHEVRRMNSCLHVFHRPCVDRWLEHGQLTCPMCRTKVVPDGVAASERIRGAGADVEEESPESMHAAAPSWASSSSFLVAAVES